MVNSFIGAVALAALPSALAFSNASPYFFFSTAEVLIPGAETEVATALDVTDRLIESLKSCPTKSYIVVEQHGVSAADYIDEHAAPRLRSYVANSGGNDNKIRSSMIIPEVISGASRFSKMATPAQQIADYIRQNCGAVDVEEATTSVSKDAKKITTFAMDAPRTEQDLGKTDAKIEDLIVDLSGSEDYDFTVIYTTTPREEPLTHAASGKKATYEMESTFDDAVQMELKRDLSSHRRASSSKEGALFERYQYFTPGIFMAFIAIIPMFSIIIVGLRALTSLEVSYFAFSKEMGPAASRK